jgi:tetratricopeptide (TPR) repeat protein
LNYPGYNKATKREASYYVGNWYKIEETELDSAKKYLKICESLSRELDVEKQTGFLANTVLYLGMIYDMQGYRNLAIKKYKEVLEIEEYHQSHKLAEQYLANPYKGIRRLK